MSLRFRKSLVISGAFALAVFTSVFQKPCRAENYVETVLSANGTVRIKVTTTDWDGGLPENVAKVLASAASQIVRNARLESDITVSVSKGAPDSLPITLFDKGPNGEYRVELEARDRYWAKYTFQFSHEIVHVLLRTKLHSDRDRFGTNSWLAEALAHTASLYALRRMSEEWKTKPPYSNWADFAPSLASYASDQLKSDMSSGMDPKSLVFQAWVWDNLYRLQRERQLTPDSRYVAAMLLPIFERRPEGWDAIRYLNMNDSDLDVDFSTYLKTWVARCPANLKPAASEISFALGVRAS